ncbi:MAG: hypothetical protein L0Y73_01275 [Candidatus Aminicenantes bacterium]|nr:hypothetical protein [Candidatus Aminicenantes bacterium]
MDAFFNELSVDEAPNKETARMWMANLIEVYKKAMHLGFRELRTSADFMNSKLTADYTIYNWLYDRAIDTDTRLLLKTKAAKSPFIETLLNREDDEKHRLQEFKYKGSCAEGLGAAYLFDSLALSFDNSSEWDNYIIKLNIAEYSEENDNFINNTIEVKHSSKLGHLYYLSDWIEDKKKSDITDGKLLWLKRKEIFPHLVFCRRVEDQISDLIPTLPEFHAVVRKLFEFEKYCSSWESGFFTGENFPSKLTPESESRLHEFKDKLDILCPDGKTRLFSWHVRYTPGPGRIYLFPDNTGKKIYIGYIGPKIL